MPTIEIATSQKVDIDYTLAETKQRVLAGILDLVFLGIAFSLQSMLLAYASPAIFGTRTFGFLFYFEYLMYFLLMNTYAGGQTFGKKLIGIKVVSIDGKKLHLGDHLIRMVLRIGEVDACFGIVAILLSAITERNQRVGDFAANTVVVNARPRSKFTIDDINSIGSIEGYTVTYPQVKQLTDEDMLLVKETLTRTLKYKNEAHQSTLGALAVKLAELLDVPVAQKDHKAFLHTLLRDYIVLTR